MDIATRHMYRRAIVAASFAVVVVALAQRPSDGRPELAPNPDRIAPPVAADPMRIATRFDGSDTLHSGAAGLLMRNDCAPPTPRRPQGARQASALKLAQSEP